MRIGRSLVLGWDTNDCTLPGANFGCSLVIFVWSPIPNRFFQIPGFLHPDLDKVTILM